MSTITTNPYAISYSTSNIMNDTVASSLSPSSSSTSSNSSSSTSSGTYSQGLISSMSGFDVNSMVNQMMTSDLIKLNKLLSNQQTTQWTQDRYSSVITNMNTFSSNYFDVLSSNNMLLPTKYNVNTATSTNSSVSSTVDNSAKQGNYSISWTQLASAAKLTNAPSLSGTITNSSTVSSLLSSNASLPTSGTLSFTVNGQNVTYDLTANANQSVSQLMTSLSSQCGATFSYSELTGKFSIIDNTSGQGNYLTISSTDSNTQKFLDGIFGTTFGSTGKTAEDIGNPTPGSNPNLGTAGQNGSFTITEPDGSTNSTPISSSSNTLTYDGVTYNVSSSAGANGSSTITVGSDVSSVVSKIQTFVNDYNNLIGGIQDAVNEKKDYSYQPLTAAQQSKMTTDQITAWNQKAQTGLLSNDDTLNSMLTSMREAFYTPINGIGLTMADIGLSTSDDPTQGGKLTLDTTKLTTALQNNPQEVINMLTQTSTSVTSYSPDLTSDQLSTRNSEEGIFQRLNDITQQYVGTQIDSNGNQGILLMKAGMPNTISATNNTFYKQLLTESQAITDFKTQITSDQKMYTTKFTALQTALSQMTSQQNYLSSMLSSSSSG